MNKIIGRHKLVVFNNKWISSKTQSFNKTAGREGKQLKYANLTTSAKKYTLWGFPSINEAKAHINADVVDDVIRNFRLITNELGDNNEYTYYTCKCNNTDYKSNCSGFNAVQVDNETDCTRTTICFSTQVDPIAVVEPISTAKTIINIIKQPMNELFEGL